MITLRINKPFKTNNDVTEFLSTNGIIIDDEKNKVIISNIGINSEYFTIHVIVDSGDYTFNSVAFVYRNSRNGQWPIILWQHIE